MLHMNTDTTTTLTIPMTLVDVPTGALVTYTYTREGLDTTVTGRKGRPVNAHLGRDLGTELLDESGNRVATVSRYAHVQVVLA